MIDSDEYWTPLLADDEKLLWSGVPHGDLHFGVETIATGIFGVIVIAASYGVGLLLTSVSGGSPWPIVGIGVLVAGAIMLLFPILDMIARRNSLYAVTNRRAFIHNRFRRTRMGADTDGWPLTKPEKITLKVGPPDTIYFAVRAKASKIGTIEGKFDPGFDVGFVRINDGETVYNLMVSIAEANAKKT